MMQASASGYMYMYATSLLFYNRKSAARFEGTCLARLMCLLQEQKHMFMPRRIVARTLKL